MEQRIPWGAYLLCCAWLGILGIFGIVWGVRGTRDRLGIEFLICGMALGLGVLGFSGFWVFNVWFFCVQASLFCKASLCRD